MKNQPPLPLVRLGQHCATRGHCVQEKILGGTGFLGLREEGVGSVNSWVSGRKALDTQGPESLLQHILGARFLGSKSQELTVLDGFLYPVSELAEVGVDSWHVG